ncbi:hypothetical protein UY3_11126 [Chelonia mydas]|uniref:Uncharacterized protein n=1 Tax=Chelonia mydas TaxID=8469 RepID=M7B3T0_CHEMY|nr:hypothetical protein UY3_11126 [Chelonia mydas]
MRITADINRYLRNRKALLGTAVVKGAERGAATPRSQCPTPTAPLARLYRPQPRPLWRASGLPAAVPGHALVFKQRACSQTGDADSCVEGMGSGLGAGLRAVQLHGGTTISRALAPGSSGPTRSAPFTTAVPRRALRFCGYRFISAHICIRGCKIVSAQGSNCGYKSAVQVDSVLLSTVKMTAII